jgi:type IV pilus assembly protein PilE
MKKLKTSQGITLIELLVTVVIVSILIILAVIMYSTQVRNGRRADATSTIFSIALAEEQYRASNTQYGTLAQVWNGVTTSPGGYYSLTITNVSATSYTITANAIGDQVNDKEGSTNCASLILAMSSGTATKTPSTCWPS